MHACARWGRDARRASLRALPQHSADDLICGLAGWLTAVCEVADASTAQRLTTRAALYTLPQRA